MEQELYELPEGWETKLIGEVVKLEYGKPLPKEDRHEEGKFPAYGANGIKCRTNKYFFDRPSIIVGRKGSAGEVNLTEDKFWPLDVTYFVTFNEEKYDLVFLYYCLKSLKLTKLAKGVKPGINRNNVYQIDFSFPPLNEQKRIVAKLDALFTRIDTAITHLQQTLELSKALFASALDEAFSPEKNKGESVSLNQVAEVARGKSKHRPRNDKTLFGGDYPFIQTGDVRNAEKYVTAYSTTYNEKGLAQSKLWPKGTICLTIAANIGEVAILGMDACFPDSVVGISSDHDSNDYIYYFLTTLQRHLDSKATMAAQKNINLRVLSEIEIPLPDINDQIRIVTHLDALSERTSALEAATEEKLNDLTTLKASLLDAAFKGQL